MQQWSKNLFNHMFYRIKKLYYDTLRRCLGDWRLFLCDERRHEHEVIRSHYHDNTANRLKNKTIIYVANGFCNHAGLSDRLKGMITLYGWCKEHCLDFRILHTHPFDLHNYIVPNQYDWRINNSMMCYNKRNTEVCHLMLNQLVRKFIDSGEVVSLEHHWFLKRVLSTKKKQIHFYTNMQPESNEWFGTCFHELFKPSPSLAFEIIHHRQAIGGAYISVSFRFMQLLGDFIDCDGDTLPTEQQDDLIRRSILVLQELKGQNRDITHILVTADSIRFLQKAKQLSFVYIVEGKVGHINFESSDEVYMKTFLDFFMISNAQKVYLAKSEKMYNSDFARRASMINCRPFNIIEY